MQHFRPARSIAEVVQISLDRGVGGMLRLDVLRVWLRWVRVQIAVGLFVLARWIEPELLAGVLQAYAEHDGTRVDREVQWLSRQ